MDAWSGMERFLHLSLGSQVGASGVALIAVLALKQRLQYPEGGQGSSGSSGWIVRLTAEEWRTVAGIHERKTFERAKAKLEELEVLHIQRNGKLLEVTLWPDEIQVKESEPSRVPDETSCETSSETSKETSCETSNETRTVSMSECALKTREDEVFPSPDVVKPVVNTTGLVKNSLRRYPLNRHSLNRHSNYFNNNNVSNDTTNNDQRYTESQDTEKRLLEFAILWVQEVGHPLTPYEKEGLLRFMRLGYTEELFVEALRCAVAADNRRMGYVLGILRNWYQEGVRCLEDVTEAKKHWDDLRFLKRAKLG